MKKCVCPLCDGSGFISKKMVNGLAKATKCLNKQAAKIEHMEECLKLLESRRHARLDAQLEETAKLQAENDKLCAENQKLKNRIAGATV